MPYIPHTDEDRREMLATIGVDSIEALFREIPQDLLVRGDLNIPGAMDEDRLFRHLVELSGRNLNLAEHVCFLGAGIYDRYIPATIPAILSRGEFLTAYTPYQPELSQGYLQTIYEFQSMVAEIFGIDVANASMYDGATAMAEAAILAHSVNGRKRVLVSDAVHPHYREVLRTYCWSVGLEVIELSSEDGATVMPDVDELVSSVIVQSPNFFGVVEDLKSVRSGSESAGAMMIVVADPVACALLKPPGEYGADIVVGEGQPLGISMGFGGPLLGLFACKQDLVRRLPGRIVGRTSDHDGNPGYVMTLRTREQDIRREKATSNICTNEALMALAATVYMTALGARGLRQVAESSVHNTQYAIDRLTKVPGVRRKFHHNVFCEFVLELPSSAERVRDRLLEDGILAGLPLAPYYADSGNSLLIAVTESRTKAEIDQFADCLRNALS